MSTVLHPQPQFARDHWIDLCGPWRFTYDDHNQGLAQNWVQQPELFERSITVPFAPESAASGIHDPSYHPVLWYRRSFQIAPAERGQRLLLHFGAVDYRAMVWVNGQLVATHEGANTPFSADISAALLDGDAEQEIVVRAEDLPGDLAQPRGKQDWEAEPHAIWYYRTSGIWQPVWLEPVSDVYLKSVRWTPDAKRCTLRAEVQLSAASARPLQVELRLSLRGQPLLNDRYQLAGQALDRTILLDQGAIVMRGEQILWSPEHPNLIDAELVLLDGERVLDTVRSYAGIRSVDTRNGYFMLNGSPCYLRLVLEQGYWPESHLSAPSEEALRKEVELVKALGFNGIRIHQKVEDPRLLYWCDKLGLLVWGEISNAYVFSNQAVERLTREWLEVLARDYSHPCIISWVPLNESWGVPNLARDTAQQNYVRALYYLIKTLDPTRPVIGNDGWEHVVSDIWGIHDYALDGATLRARYGTPELVEQSLQNIQPGHHILEVAGAARNGAPLMITEFGGLSYAPKQGERWYGYGTVNDADSFIARYAELVNALLACPTVAGFCYTQLTDTEQETNGLLLADRSPKLDIATICAITQGLSQAMPHDSIAATRAESESISES